jgi:hypothetical protein
MPSPMGFDEAFEASEKIAEYLIGRWIPQSSLDAAQSK